MFSRRRRRVPVVVLALLVPVALVAGIWWGGHPDRLPGFLRNALAGGNSLSVVNEAFGAIERDYYRKVTRPDLVNTGLTGAVKSLDDRFSHYLDPKMFREFNRQSSGSFSGIGVTVQQDKRGLRVAEVLKGSPAAAKGFKAGDVIVAVNGRSIAGEPSEVSTGRIRGKPGTEVTLTIVSGGERRKVRLMRADVHVPVVESKLVRDGARKVIDVHLTTFATTGAHAQVATAVRRGLREGAKGVILDLRGNGGGLLEEGVLTASLFIPKGPIVITDGRSQPRHVFNAEGGAIRTSIPLAVLIDRNTASASEIVAGSIQDRKRGILVGTRSFGKGVFQEVRGLSNGGALDITVGEYFLPSGRNLGGGGVAEGKGLKPDVPARERKGDGDEILKAALRALQPKLQ